jgi:hypothetical protein
LLIDRPPGHARPASGGGDEDGERRPRLPQPVCLDVFAEGTRERLGIERDEHLLALLHGERFERLPIDGEDDATLFTLPICAHEVENEVGPFALQGLLNARARHRHGQG